MHHSRHHARASSRSSRARSRAVRAKFSNPARSGLKIVTSARAPGRAHVAMSVALARRASRRVFERVIASDVARAGAGASNAQRTRDFSVKAKTDVPPPPITANAAGTGGRSSFRCVIARVVRARARGDGCSRGRGDAGTG